MTFAVLPFEAAASDATGAKIAAAMTDAAIVAEENRPLWAQVTPRRHVARVMAEHPGGGDLGAALDVHFLVRGNVSRGAQGYVVELLVVDAARRRVIDTKSLLIPAGAMTPRRRDDLENAIGYLTYRALEVEVARAKDKPVDKLDVRDLSFRAFVDWNMRNRLQDAKGAYTAATDLLNRALALVPDDPLALYLTAKVNLCDCVDAWSRNVDEQQAIGAAAMERFLRHDPQSSSMLTLKGELYGLHGRFEESLLIAGSVLERDPDYTDALSLKAYDLLKLQRPREALAAIDEVLDRRDSQAETALAAAIHYELAQDELASKLAQKAMTQMDREESSNPRWGAVALTRVAAEARLGHRARAKVAMADFNAAVPSVQTISAVRQWMHPAADLAGYEPLFEGLRLAGVAQ